MRERIQKVLVGIDFSEHSERALSTACSLAAQAGAELEVLHAVEMPIMPPVDPFVTVPATQYMMQRIEAGAGEQTAAMQQMVDRLVGDRVPVRLHTYQGPPGDSLRTADWLEARRRLFVSGLFRRVDIVIEPQEGAADTAPVKLRVEVEEWPALRLRYGFQVAVAFGSFSLPCDVAPSTESQCRPGAGGLPLGH